MQGTLHPIFSSRQLLPHSTLKPVPPFGGLVSLIEFFNALKLGEVLGRLMPFSYSSPNAILPEQTLLAFVLSIVAGARRLAHPDWLRADRALHAMLGIERFLGTDTVRNLLKRFTLNVRRHCAAPCPAAERSWATGHVSRCSTSPKSGAEPTSTSL